MQLFRRIRFSFHMKLTRMFKRRLNIITLTLNTLFYNQLQNRSLAIDTLMEPMFWFVDHFVKYLGLVFVVLTVVLVSSALVVFYVCLIPFYWQLDQRWTCIHFTTAHWLLSNVVFNYYNVIFTSPGRPPSENISEVVSICKKCISPKPPRSHHCSICGHCVLKMDHHCPWLNNCIGHRNHRFFILFCAYMSIASAYVHFVAYPLFREHFEQDINSWSSSNHTVIEHSIDNESVETETKMHIYELSIYYYHNVVYYVLMLCSGVGAALSLLFLWHIRLVLRGETSIEVHINKKEAKRLKKIGKAYKNPYNFGWVKNLQLFFGIRNTSDIFMRLVFPSNHAPSGDGLTWEKNLPHMQLSEVL